jgi:LysR family transcriptional regulator, transcriptional activator of nhaA
MDARSLNYHHLLYFWTVVKEGGVSAASKRLRVAQPTVSGQLRALEGALGGKLLERRGRNLVRTELGALVFGYADEIFAIGAELSDALLGRPTARPARLAVGIADNMPKLVAWRILEPALRGPDAVHLVCAEGKPDLLLLDLAAHAHDLVLADAPANSLSPVRAFNHLLGESSVSIFAAPKEAARLRSGFPRSLGGARLFVPVQSAALRRSLAHWLDAEGIRPQIVAEFQDSALLAEFGRTGDGAFPAPTVVEEELRRRYGVVSAGRLPGVEERFYAISVQRRLRHPAVVAITERARSELFGGAG